MSPFRRALLASTVALLTACASSFEQLPPQASLGDPPIGFENAIKRHFESTLKDPESARYKFGRPIKAYANNGLIAGGKVAWKGYMVDVEVNAKNSYGGYVGYKPYMFFFTANTIYRVYEGNSHPLVHRLE